MSRPGTPPHGAAPELPFALRAFRVVYQDDAVILREDGFWSVRTPSNPTFFWGNFLQFDAAPAAGDEERWPALFARHIRSRQPDSGHVSLCWPGAQRGAADAFVPLGYAVEESVVMLADRLVAAAAPGRDVRCARVAGDRPWEALVQLHLRTRDPSHGAEDYERYARRKAGHWRSRAEAGQGVWMAAFAGDEVVAALGLYAESAPGPDGLRIARYQDVVTDPRWRRRGLCSTLLVRAADEIERQHRVDRLVIIADEHDSARRVYAARGFRVAGSMRGLERPGYRAPTRAAPGTI